MLTIQGNSITVMANRKTSRLTSTLNIELREKLVMYYIWRRDPDIRKIGVELFLQLRNVELEENGEDKMARKSN